MMHQTDLHLHANEANSAACSGWFPPPSHATPADLTLTHWNDALSDGSAGGWESAWIDLGGEG
jgi:hypothetical protein